MGRSANIYARVLEISKELQKGEERAAIVKKFSKKFKLSVNMIDRYIAEAKKLTEKANRVKEQAIENAIVDEAVKAVKIGLKTKYDRAMILQEQVEASIAELKKGKTSYYDAGGNKCERELTVNEKAIIRKTIKELQAEISKMEGDYAPNKVQHSGSIGVIFEEVIDYGDEGGNTDGTEEADQAVT